MEDFLAGLVRANSAIADAARKSDVACSQVLPKDLGEWRPTIEFVLGPYNCGKELSEVSTVDLARSGERDNGSFCRQGLGALLARLAAGLPHPARFAGEDHRMVEPPAPRGRFRQRPVPDRRRHRHGVDQRAHRRQAQVRARSAQASSRCRQQAQARQPRSHRVGADRQPARAAGRRARVRAEREPADRGDLRQHVRVHDLRGRRGRHFRSRSFRQGRGGDGRFCCHLACRSLRRRHQELGQAPSRHALEQRAVGARRLVRRRARRAVRAQGHDGADQQPHLLRRRGHARERSGAP